MTFARKVSITLATRIALIFVGLATSIIMARSLGPEGKGLFSLAIISAGMIFIVVNLGVGAASGFMLGRRKISLEELAGNWLSLSMLIGATALALSFAIVPLLAPRWLPSVPLWAIALALLTLPSLILVYNFQMLFRANDDFRNFNIIEAMQPVSFLVFLLPFAFLPSGSLLASSLADHLASNLVAGVGAALLMRRCVKLSVRWNGAVIGETLRFGVQHSLGNLLDFLNYRIDMLLMNYYLDPVHVGYYSISVLVAEKLWYLPNVLSAVLHPRVAHAGDEADANRDTTSISRMTVLVIGIGCLAILLIGRPVVRLLYSDRFLPAVTPLFLLLPGIFMISLSKILQSDLTARGYPRANMWAGLAAVISNVILNVILIPRIEINGAAIASTVSYSLYALVIVVYFMRVTGVRLATIVVPKAGDVRYLVVNVGRELSRMRNIGKS
ncbi:MAG: flippase [Candidatus Krumholzibacteria bacterium]|nr:flippase [Candidatus Krumholzibacteria bacterium]